MSRTAPPAVPTAITTQLLSKEDICRVFSVPIELAELLEPEPEKTQIGPLDV